MPGTFQTGHNAAIVTRFETEIIRQAARNGLVFTILIYFLRHVWLPVMSSKYEGSK